MYEPKRIPDLAHLTVPIGAMRYGAMHCRDAIDLADPTIDPLHIHGYLEIFVSVDAEVSFLVNDTVYPVGRGDALISRPGDVHVCIFPRSAAYDYYCLWIEADYSSPVFAFLKEEGFSPLRRLSTAKKQQLALTLERLCALTGNEADAVGAPMLLLTVLSLLSGAESEQTHAAELPARLYEIIRFVQRDFPKIRSTADITERFFISTSTLNRLFRTHLHTTPHAYLEAQRLSCAISMLESGASVTEAACESGFSDTSHFIQTFKKKFGQTPRRYQKREG